MTSLGSVAGAGEAGRGNGGREGKKVVGWGVEWVKRQRKGEWGEKKEYI